MNIKRFALTLLAGIVVCTFADAAKTNELPDWHPKRFLQRFLNNHICSEYKER